MPNTTETPLELDHRETDGIRVTLLWHKAANRVTVAVYDEALDHSFELEVAPDQALDAFRHPYAYAAFAGTEYAARPVETVEA